MFQIWLRWLSSMLPSILHLPCPSPCPVESQWSVSTGLHVAVLCGRSEPPLQIATEPFSFSSCGERVEWERPFWMGGLARSGSTGSGAASEFTASSIAFQMLCLPSGPVAAVRGPQMPVSFRVWLWCCCWSKTQDTHIHFTFSPLI